MKQGGLTAEFFSLYIKPWYVEHGGSVRRTLDMIDSVYRAVERHPRDLMIATSVADIRRAKRLNKIACLMGIEGGHAIEDSLPTLREFYRLGVRYMTLTWNNTNNWADANRDPKRHGGLNDFGREVARRHLARLRRNDERRARRFQSARYRFSLICTRAQRRVAKRSR
jgi:membrane dipeptidase